MEAETIFPIIDTTANTLAYVLFVTTWVTTWGFGGVYLNYQMGNVPMVLVSALLLVLPLGLYAVSRLLKSK